jgi:hypothetical protein
MDMSPDNRAKGQKIDKKVMVYGYITLFETIIYLISIGVEYGKKYLDKPHN